MTDELPAPPKPIAISLSVDADGAASMNYLCSHETMVKTLRTIADDIESKHLVPTDDRPHSRACGISCNGHGPQCHKNCPTCGGK